jgi:hypothetical protein
VQADKWGSPVSRRRPPWVKRALRSSFEISAASFVVAKPQCLGDNRYKSLTPRHARVHWAAPAAARSGLHPAIQAFIPRQESTRIRDDPPTPVRVHGPASARFNKSKKGRCLSFVCNAGLIAWCGVMGPKRERERERERGHGPCAMTVALNRSLSNCDGDRRRRDFVFRRVVRRGPRTQQRRTEQNVDPRINRYD